MYAPLRAEVFFDYRHATTANGAGKLWCSDMHSSHLLDKDENTSDGDVITQMKTVKGMLHSYPDAAVTLIATLLHCRCVPIIVDNIAIH